MDFGDIITILIIVGGVIIGLVKKSMDQGNPPPQKSPTPKIPDVIKEAFPNLENWMEEEPVAKPEWSKPVESTKMPAAVSSEVIPMTPAFSYDSLDYSEHSAIQKTKENNMTYISEEYCEFEDFNIRKAVIYSEILKRPEY